MVKSALRWDHPDKGKKDDSDDSGGDFVRGGNDDFEDKRERFCDDDIIV